MLAVQDSSERTAPHAPATKLPASTIASTQYSIASPIRFNRESSSMIKAWHGAYAVGKFYSRGTAGGVILSAIRPNALCILCTEIETEMSSARYANKVT